MNWKNGDDSIIVPAVSDEEAKKKFPEGWKALKPYLRIVKGFEGFDAVRSRSCALELDIVARKTARGTAIHEIDRFAMGPLFQRLCLAAFGP